MCITKIDVSFKEIKVSIHKSVRLGSEGVSIICILCVLAVCIGDLSAVMLARLNAETKGYLKDWQAGFRQ